MRARPLLPRSLTRPASLPPSYPRHRAVHLPPVQGASADARDHLARGPPPGPRAYPLPAFPSLALGAHLLHRARARPSQDGTNTILYSWDLRSLCNNGQGYSFTNSTTNTLFRFEICGSLDPVVPTLPPFVGDGTLQGQVVGSAQTNTYCNPEYNAYPNVGNFLQFFDPNPQQSASVVQRLSAAHARRRCSRRAGRRATARLRARSRPLAAGGTSPLGGRGRKGRRRCLQLLPAAPVL